MAHTPGHKVIAEGIDTEAQAAPLRSLGCDELQSYFYSRPRSGNAVFRAAGARPMWASKSEAGERSDCVDGAGPGLAGAATSNARLEGLPGAQPRQALA